MKGGVPTKNPEFGVNMKYFSIFFATSVVVDVSVMSFTYIFAFIKIEGKEVNNLNGNQDMFIGK